MKIVREEIAFFLDWPAEIFADFQGAADPDVKRHCCACDLLSMSVARALTQSNRRS